MAEHIEPIRLFQLSRLACVTDPRESSHLRECPDCGRIVSKFQSYHHPAAQDSGTVRDSRAGNYGVSKSITMEEAAD